LLHGLNVSQQLAGFGIQSQHAGRVEVISRVERQKEVRSDIAGRNPEDTVVRIETVRGPRSSAGWRILRGDVFPGRACRTVIGNNIEAPKLVSIGSAERIDTTGNTENVPTGVSCKHHPVPGDGRQRKGLAFGYVGNWHVPDGLTAGCVQSGQVPVGGSAE